MTVANTFYREKERRKRDQFSGKAKVRKVILIGKC